LFSPSIFFFFKENGLKENKKQKIKRKMAKRTTPKFPHGFVYS